MAVENDFEYSRVAYPGVADGIIQLRNLEAAATVFGLQPAALNSCRVLEIGCADGPNILPFAAEFPNSQFMGVDLVADRVAEARAAAESIGLTNVEFRHANVTEIDATFGLFDYILCPGVFSWATEPEQQAILQVCRENLTETGIAAISYNVLPGWNFRGTVRELIRRHVRVFDDPQKQIAEARRAVDFIVRSTPQTTPHGMMYAQIQESFRTATDHYIYHDFISDRNQPFYFHQFAELLHGAGLQYVAEADITLTAAMGVPAEATQALNRVPVPDREQLLDFLLNTSYRRSIVCRAGRQVNRRLDYRSMQGLSVALVQPFPDSDLAVASRDPVQIRYDGGSLTTAEPLGKAALRHLMSVWPQAVAVADLYPLACRLLPAEFHTPPVGDPDSLTDGAQVLARSMLAAWGAGLVRAWRTPPVLAAEVSAHPMASPVVRYQAQHGHVVVNQWHQNLSNLTPEQRYIVRRLDGATEVAKLISDFSEWKQDSSATAEAQAILQDLVSRCLLVQS